MSDDPLSKFMNRTGRTPPSASPSKPNGPALVVNRQGSREPYEAFGCKDRVPTLHLRGKGFAHAVSYHYLVVTSYNPDRYDKIILTFGNMLVAITGRNLRPIVDAIAMHTCEVVQQFISEKFLEPADPEAPFIEKVTADVMNPGARVAVESLANGGSRQE
jgi:hypothetical protein